MKGYKTKLERAQEEKMKAVEAALEEQLLKEASQEKEKAYLADQKAQQYSILEDNDDKRRLEALTLAKKASSAATKTLDEQIENESAAIAIRRQELERV